MSARTYDECLADIRAEAAKSPPVIVQKSGGSVITAKSSDTARIAELERENYELKWRLGAKIREQSTTTGTAQARVHAKAERIREANPQLTQHQAFAKALEQDPALYRELREEERANQARAAEEYAAKREAARKSSLEATGKIQAKAAELRKANPTLTDATARIEARRLNPDLAQQERGVMVR